MYARVPRLEVDADKIDRGVEVYEDGCVPEARQQEGFLDAMLLGDRKT